MENEINKLKINYQKTSPPEFLITDGVNDLWNRVDNHKRITNKHHIYLTSLGILIFIIFSGFFGIISAQAKPGSTFYPVKSLTKEATSTFSESSAVKFYNSQIKQKQQASPTITPKPSATISPAPTTLELENEAENQVKEKDEDNSGLRKNHTDNKEVKGVNIFEEKKYENNITSENSKDNIENSRKSESENHDNENKENNRKIDKKNEN